MTPSEAARALVEECQIDYPITGLLVDKERLIACLTPVFEAAQERDTWKRIAERECELGKDTREAAHIAGSLAYRDAAALRERAAQAERARDLYARQAGEFAARAERAEAERDSERQQREHLFVCEFAGWKTRAERAEAERDSVRERSVAEVQEARTERDAAEADVKRLRDALQSLAVMPPWEDQQPIALDALAATAPKRT